jgi:hypothetical protein
MGKRECERAKTLQQAMPLASQRSWCNPLRKKNIGVSPFCDDALEIANLSFEVVEYVVVQFADMVSRLMR